MITDNSLVMLLSLIDGKKLFLTLTAGRRFSTLHGEIVHDSVKEAGYGAKIASHLGKEFLVLRPSLYDLMMSLPRPTQIVYPKDAGYILIKLGVRNGDRVLEAGTGSGAFTVGLAYAAAPQGRVFSYERREDILQKALRNLELAGVSDFVQTKLRDIESEGFDETEADAVFFDMRAPSRALDHAWQALRPGGTFGLILPTMNQVSQVLENIRRLDFVDIEATEIMIRHYKLNPERMRPEDRMIAHTGYLVFARKNACTQEAPQC